MVIAQVLEGSENFKKSGAVFTIFSREVDAVPPVTVISVSLSCFFGLLLTRVYQEEIDYIYDLFIIHLKLTKGKLRAKDGA